MFLRIPRFELLGEPFLVASTRAGIWLNLIAVMLLVGTYVLYGWVGGVVAVYEFVVNAILRAMRWAINPPGLAAGARVGRL